MGAFDNFGLEIVEGLLSRFMTSPPQIQLVYKGRCIIHAMIGSFSAICEPRSEAIHNGTLQGGGLYAHIVIVWAASPSSVILPSLNGHS